MGLIFIYQNLKNFSPEKVLNEQLAIAETDLKKLKRKYLIDENVDQETL